MTANYHVNDYGILKIYDTESGRIIAEIWGCKDKTKSELEEMVEDILEEMEYDDTY